MVYIRPLRKSRRKRRPRNNHKVNTSHKLNKKLVGGLEMPSPSPRMSFNKLTPPLSSMTKSSSTLLQAPVELTDFEKKENEKKLDEEVKENTVPDADLEILKQFKVMDCKQIREYIDKTKFTEEEKIKFIKQHMNSSNMLRDYVKKHKMSTDEIQLAVESGKFILNTLTDKMMEMKDFVFSQEAEIQKDPDCQVLSEMVDSYEKEQLRKTKKSVNKKSASAKKKSATPRNKWSAAKRRVKKLGNAALGKVANVGNAAYNAVTTENIKGALNYSKDKLASAFSYSKKAFVTVYNIIKWLMKKGFEIWTYVNDNPLLILMTCMFIEEIKSHLCLWVGSLLGHITKTNIGEHWNSLINSLSFILPSALREQLLADYNSEDPSQLARMWDWFQTFTKTSALDYVSKNGMEMMHDAMGSVKSYAVPILTSAIAIVTGGTSLLVSGAIGVVFSVICDSVEKSVGQSLVLSAQLSTVKSVFSKLFDVVNPSKCIASMAKQQQETVDLHAIIDNIDLLQGKDKILWESYSKKKNIIKFTELDKQERTKIYDKFLDEKNSLYTYLDYFTKDFDYIDKNRRIMQLIFNDDSHDAKKHRENVLNPNSFEQFDEELKVIFKLNGANRGYGEEIFGTELFKQFLNYRPPEEEVKILEKVSATMDEFQEVTTSFSSEWQNFLSYYEINDYQINTENGLIVYFKLFKIYLNCISLIKMYLYNNDSEKITETRKKIIQLPDKTKKSIISELIKLPDTKFDFRDRDHDSFKAYKFFPRFLDILTSWNISTNIIPSYFDRRSIFSDFVDFLKNIVNVKDQFPGRYYGITDWHPISYIFNEQEYQKELEESFKKFQQYILQSKFY